MRWRTGFMRARFRRGFMTKHRVAVIGIGKISIDQHLPVIAKSGDFELAATVSQRGVSVGSAPSFKTASELYAAMPDVDAVAICTPPGVRHALVREALDAGKHVLMEKPPTATICELDDLVAHGKRSGKVLFATWHSQYNESVDRARDILAKDGVRYVRIDWRENVRKWHPGQDWVWEPGGFGVCDPGINAMSIFTKIMPVPVFIDSATLTYPSNRQTPVDVEINFKTGDADGPDLSAGFNWLEGDQEVWTFTIATGKGQTLKLRNGGAILDIDGQETVNEKPREYEGIYAHFAELLKSGKSDIHDAPLRLIADAFFVGRRETGPVFDW
jgi:D-galactose 1-dehydrogenase